MKKGIIITVLFICTMITGCSTSGQEVETKDIKQLEARIMELEKENTELRAKTVSPTDSDPVTTKDIKMDKVDIKDINIGDTITTDRMELTLKNIELSYDVLPKDTSGFYTHYPADSGKVYIDVDTEIKNIQKQSLECDDIMEIEADYNNGFNYSSMTIPEDSSGFTYANITSIKPLETMGVRFLIDCPQEVEESDNPLFLIFEVDNQIFKYTIR